jgi:hypothetical protein
MRVIAVKVIVVCRGSGGRRCGVQVEQVRYAEPVEGSELGEGVDRLVEDEMAVGVDAWRREFRVVGDSQRRAGHETSRSTTVSRVANGSARSVWFLLAASSCWACRVGRNPIVVWK